MQSTPNGRQLYIDPGCCIESAERTSTQVTRRANRKTRLTVHYIVEHPNQEGDTCIDWTSQYCWTNGWNCLWRGHSNYRNRPLIPLLQWDRGRCHHGVYIPEYGSIRPNNHKGTLSWPLGGGGVAMVHSSYQNIRQKQTTATLNPHVEAGITAHAGHSDASFRRRRMHYH